MKQANGYYGGKRCHAKGRNPDTRADRARRRRAGITGLPGYAVGKGESQPGKGDLSRASPAPERIIPGRRRCPALFGLQLLMHKHQPWAEGVPVPPSDRSGSLRSGVVSSKSAGADFEDNHLKQLYLS